MNTQDKHKPCNAALSKLVVENARLRAALLDILNKAVAATPSNRQQWMRELRQIEARRYMHPGDYTRAAIIRACIRAEEIDA